MSDLAAIYRRIGQLIALGYAEGEIDLRPTEAMRQAAKKGLELRRAAPKSRKGGLTAKQASDAGVGSGVQRASDIINRDTLSPETWRRMKAFFDRHSAYKDKHTIDPPSKSYISWLLWGGDPGFSRANQIVAKLNTLRGGNDDR